MSRRSSIASALFLLLVAAGDGSGAGEGEVRVHGALRDMMHEGQTGSVVALDSLLPDPGLHAVGALAELAGEVTIAAGQVYLSYPDGESTRTEAVDRTAEGASLLVATSVAGWRSVTVERRISFDELDEEIGRLAGKAGMDLDDHFPFRVEGEVEELRWHVIDGRRLEKGGSSHADHLASSVRETRDRTFATLVGFHSRHARGLFTHIDSTTHIHCVVREPLAAGHVDHVVLPAGTVVEFPAVPARE